MFVFRHTPNDWKLSRAMLKEAADAITHDVQIVRDFDIPYVAGYSIDRKTFYIDHTLPRGFDLGDGDFFDVTMTLILHEAIEAALEKMLPSFPYEGAHQIAFQAEEVVSIANVTTISSMDGLTKSLSGRGLKTAR
jgi:hypothetical protein